MAWSKYKNSIINYVENNPGCSKWEVASLCTQSSRRCPSKQYYIVNTALRNGWIYGYMAKGQYRLYTGDYIATLPDCNPLKLFLKLPNRYASKVELKGV